VLIGTSNEPTTINLAKDVVFRSVHIHGVTGRRLWHTWDKMKGLLASGQLDVEPVITHRFPFSDYDKGFELMNTGNCGKVVLEF
jgi:threonine 3-dehydrogenase